MSSDVDQPGEMQARAASASGAAPQKPPLTPLVPLSEASGLCGGPGQLSCDEANDLIQTYLDEAVDPDTGTKLTEHLGDCPPCEHEFVVYQRIVDALGRCREELPADTAARLQQYCSSLCDGTDPAVASTEAAGPSES
jgi:Putative zinc-finger